VEWEVKDGNVTGPAKDSSAPKTSGGLRVAIQHSIDTLERISEEQEIADFADFVLAARFLEEVTGIAANTTKSRGGTGYASWVAFDQDLASWTDWIEGNQDRLYKSASSWSVELTPSDIEIEARVEPEEIKLRMINLSNQFRELIATL
jgi:hypothetical protein